MLNPRKPRTFIPSKYTRYTLSLNFKVLSGYLENVQDSEIIRRYTQLVSVWPKAIDLRYLPRGSYRALKGQGI